MISKPSPTQNSPDLARIVKWGDQFQLVAARSIEKGERVLGDAPIAFVETKAEEEDRGPMLLVDMILSHTDVLSQVNSIGLNLMRWPLDKADLDAIDQLAQKHKRKTKKIRQLYCQVASNNIHYRHEVVSGFGIWPTLTRSNHSCAPNTQLRAAKYEPLVEMLIATQRISEGEPVTWNYLSSAEFLELNVQERQARLKHHFQFQCLCDRCIAEKLD